MSFRSRRVVVTGVGAVSPLGLTMKESWEALLQHRSGLKSLAEALEWQCLSDESLKHETGLSVGLPCQVAAPVRWVDQKEHRIARHVQFALSAAHQAGEQAKLSDWLNSEEQNSEKKQKLCQRIGVSMGCGMSSLRDITSNYQTLMDAGYRKISPHFIPKALTNSASGRISIEYGLLGPNCTTSTACAAAAHAIGDAYRIIQLNQADVMLAGGSEGSIEPVGIAGFCRLRALSTNFNSDPTKSSRPFDANRDGFVMGEGAAVLVLEEMEHAKSRGAPLLAEVVGYGLAGDGHHITAPDTQGRGAEHAMRMALNFDDSLAAHVDYVNAHATSTPVGDEIEARVIHRVFNQSLSSNASTQREKTLYVSSTKGATGHLLGAAGAIEAAFTVQALVDQILPPTLNLDSVEEELSFEHVSSTTARKNGEIQVAMSNSFGFGGTNASLVFSRINS